MSAVLCRQHVPELHACRLCDRFRAAFRILHGKCEQLAAQRVFVFARVFRGDLRRGAAGGEQGERPAKGGGIRAELRPDAAHGGIPRKFPCPHAVFIGDRLVVRFGAQREGAHVLSGGARLRKGGDRRRGCLFRGVHRSCKVRLRTPDRERQSHRIGFYAQFSAPRYSDRSFFSHIYFSFSTDFLYSMGTYLMPSLQISPSVAEKPSFL